MRSIKITTPPLDKFVKRKSTKPTEQLIIPKQKEVNLMNPELKEKGLNNINSNNNIQKKENITNKYDEIIKTKKDKTKKCDKKDKDEK